MLTRQRSKFKMGQKKANATPDTCGGLLGPPNLVWFHYAPSRAGEVPARILDDYQGALHTDAYAGYNQVLIPDKCVRLACLAHVRRKFLDIQKIAGKDSAHVLTLIAKAYRLESSLKTPEQRFAVRQTKTRELFDALFSYLKAWGQRTLPKKSCHGRHSVRAQPRARGLPYS